MSTPQDIAKNLMAQDKPKSLQALIESSAKELGRALPEHMRAERIVRIALTCIRTNPELSKCTPESFLGALFTSAQIGVEPIAGRAYLLPFNSKRKQPDGTWHTVKECQFILGYRGVVDLFYRHEKAINLAWGVRHTNDPFEIVLGTEPKLTHIPIDGDRGVVVGFWALANLANGGKAFHYMTLDECIQHGKDHSKTYDKKNNAWYDTSPWLKDPEPMCLKTVLTQGAKIWPVSIELQRALEADESARDMRPGVTDVLDIPSQVSWDEVVKEVRDREEKLTAEAEGQTK